MDSARVAEIYDELLRLKVDLADNPAERGPGYIAASIKRCRDCVEALNKIHHEVEKAYVYHRNRVRLLKLEFQELLRAKTLSVEIQDMEGVSLSEKKQYALIKLEQERQIKIRREYRDKGLEPPEYIPTLEQELCKVS